MKQVQSNRKNKIWNSLLLLLSIIGLIICIALLFQQVRANIIVFLEQIINRKVYSYQEWLDTFKSFALGGIFFILLFNYCKFSNSGRALVQNVKQEINDCLSDIDFHSLLKPVFLLSVVYLLGIITIIRANFLYFDDIRNSVEGVIEWHNWSRYITVFSAILIHGDINITDISPLPQLLAILILSISSVLLVYIINNKKITTLGLLASIPLGLSPFFLQCLSYKFDAPYLALSVLSSIIPFLFIDRKKAFFCVSVVSLLVVCMTYQVASGIYPMIVIILCFQDWNRRKKTNKEILSSIGIVAVSFCFSMLVFRFFLMKRVELDGFYSSTKIYSITYLIPGILNNVKDYFMTINQDLGVIWKIGIAFVCIFFITKTVYVSSRKKILSFLLSILVIGLSFIISYGIYLLLEKPLYAPRHLFGSGVLLAILCIFVVSDYKKYATITVLALNWCFFVFAFSYGNTLADQARYAEFRIGILLHDLSVLFPEQNKEDTLLQFQNSIDYAPTVKNLLKQYPITEELVPKRLGNTGSYFDYSYLLDHFNYNRIKLDSISLIKFDEMNLPVVLDSYYHTIKSDGEHILVILKH